MNVDDIINLTDEQLKQIFAYIDKNLGIHKTDKPLTKEEIIQQALHTEEGRIALANATVEPMRKKSLEYHSVSNKWYNSNDEKK